MSGTRIALAAAMTLIATCGAVGNFGAAQAGQPTGPSRGTVFVTERVGGTVSAFDAGTGAVAWTTAVGASPTGVTQPHRTDKVYTSNEVAATMSILDRDTGDLLGEIPTGPLPHHLMAAPNGKRIYVAEFGHNRIGVIDTTTDERISFATSRLPSARAHAVFVTRDDRFVYATNSRADRSQPGDVAKLDARSGELLCNTQVGSDPSEILVTPDGRTGYVSVRRENKVKELDLTGSCPVLTERFAVVGTQPDTLQLTNDGALLVVTLRGASAEISFLNTKTFAVRHVSIPGHNTTGHHSMSANSAYTFVAVESPGGLAVVDNATGEVIADHPYPGGPRPHGVLYQPQRIE